jgi:hypothetical protein
MKMAQTGISTQSAVTHLLLFLVSGFIALVAGAGLLVAGPSERYGRVGVFFAAIGLLFFICGFIRLLDY